MSQALTFAVHIRHSLVTSSSGDFDADRYAEIISRVEELGYDDVLLADHVFVPPYWANVIGDVFFEPFTLFSYLAARTSRINLTLGCLVVPYRQPFATAKMVAAVDQLSGGRFALGVVPGYLKEEFETFRLPRNERNQMTNEFVRIMTRLWTSDSVTYDGRYYSCDGVTIKPKCVQRPHVPIWVGGSSRNAMRRVAEFGNVWHPLGFEPVDEAYFAAHKERFHRQHANGRHDAGTTSRRARLHPDSGRSRIARHQCVKGSGECWGAGERWKWRGDSRQDWRRDSTRRRQSALDWLGRYVEAGATGFSIGPPGETPEECLDVLAGFVEDVVPRLG